MRSNPYQVLGLKPGVSNEALKRRYRRRLLSVHPDHNPNDPLAEAKTQAVIEAYQHLSDPLKRAELDERLEWEALRRAQAERKSETQKAKGRKKRGKGSKGGSSSRKARAQYGHSTVIINGEVFESDSSGCINVMMGNSRVHIQQTVSSFDGHGSESVTIQMQNHIGDSDAIAEHVDTIINRVMSKLYRY